MRSIFLLLAIFGALVPYYFFIGFFASHGSDLPIFIQGLFANGAAGGFSTDLLITSFAFWLYLWHRQTPHWWVYVLVNLTIGLSCALPAYIYWSWSQGTSQEKTQAEQG